MKKLLAKSTGLLLLIAGIFSAGMGIKGFLLSSGFIDGGVTGASMVLAAVTGIPLALFIPAINLPFILVAYRQIGGGFALRSALGIAGLSLCLAFVPFPDVTPDKLLTAVFGGFFLGAGIGLAIRGGAVLDGTEIMALLVSRSRRILRVGDVILMFNVVLFSVAALVLGIESALYSILTYLAASKTVDFIVYGLEGYHGVLIVSPRNEEIRLALLNDIGRGVTVYRGRGGMSEAEGDILYCVVTRLEIPKVRQIAETVDPSSFIVVQHVADVIGGTIKRRTLH